MATTSRNGFLGECRATIGVVEVNAAEIPEAQEDRALLTEVVGKIEEADHRQKHHKFQFQQATRDLEQLVFQARDLLLRLKNKIRGRYGMAAEKLAEYGLNPRRPSRLTAVTKKKPAEVGPTQPQPAPSETDGAIQK